MIEKIPHRLENSTESTSLSCGLLIPLRSKTTSLVIYDGQRSGSQNPRWRDQVSRGINATTSYTRSGYIVNKAVPVTYDFRSKCSPGQVNKENAFFQGKILRYPDPTDFYAAPSSNLSSASNSAIMSFIHDAKAQYNSMSGGVFLGELRETLNMIRNPSKALFSQASLYLDRLKGRRGTFRTRREADNFLAKSWLEASFGWLPLISDCKAGAEGLARLIHGDTRFASVKGFGQYTASSNPTQSNFNVPGFILGTRETFVTTKDTVIIKGGVSATATGPTLENAMHIFGFTPEEFVPTIYNLIPYSFLVDYFVNVGDILEATFFDKSGLTWISRTELSEKIFHDNLYHKARQPGWIGSSEGGSYTVTKKSMSRSPSTPLVPTLQVSLPGSPQKWINLAALAATHKSLTPYFI